MGSLKTPINPLMLSRTFHPYYSVLLSLKQAAEWFFKINSDVLTTVQNLLKCLEEYKKNHSSHYLIEFLRTCIL